jgi:murein DD-endopeptidase MepM/ murein hydrolase activator NlpD
MKGDDVGEWQQWLKMTFERWDIDYPIKVDGVYGQATRSATASMCMAMGLASAGSAMKAGVKPELRTKLRHRHLSAAEKKRFESASRKKYRADLRDRYRDGGICSPTPRITQDSWGWVKGVHDGIDLITPADAPLHAICAGRVIRADPDGWWGKAPSGDVRKGDGIIIIRASDDHGPIKKGMNLCYGHAEHPKVKEGENVKAGQRIGTAGLAVVPHIHFMVNDDNSDRGVGDRDPRPIYNYVKKNG